MRQDVIVIGGSYAGLSAALQLARARRRVLVVDAGRPRNRHAGAGHGFLGHDGRAPGDMLRGARDQLAAYPTVSFAEAEVTSAVATPDGFELNCDDGRLETGRRLVLATGVLDDLPPVPGLQERWGRTVLHCPYCHGYEVAGGPLGVLATQALSAHQARLVADWGPTTYFTQGRFEPGDEDMALLAASRVRIERSPVIGLIGEGTGLDAVRLADGRSVPLRALFTAPHTRPAGALAAGLGCAYEEGPSGPVLQVDAWKQTTVPGVYAAGDASAAMHNATLASASGVMAGVGVHQSLLPSVTATRP